MTRTRARILIGLSAFIIVVLIGGGIWWAWQCKSVGATAPVSEVTVSAPASGTEGVYADVDRSDRDAVAMRAAKILSTWDPSQDDTEAAAVHRAKPLLSTTAFEQNTTPVRNGSAGLWMEMAAKNAKSFPRVEIQDDEYAAVERPNPDALTVLARWEWIGPSSRTNNPETRMFFMQMQQNAQGEWEVGDYTYTDVPNSYLGNGFE